MDGENIEVGESHSLKSLVNQVRDELEATERVLVGIKINGSFLNQSELESQLTSKIDGKEIELLTEYTGELRGSMVNQALSYLDDLEDWHEGIDYPMDGTILSEVEIRELEQVFEGLVWLSLALDNLATIREGNPVYNGRAFPKFMDESKMFLAEMEGALERSEENERLLTRLFFNDLPTWIEDYREVFRETRDYLGGPYDYN
ncbi:hypothetical protein KGY64_03730 [Candidatus Bipolaricaulota bacterium]|nr:hypothetical protein [Candidatus Bipolaricaulota bacterium]